MCLAVGLPAAQAKDQAATRTAKNTGATKTIAAAQAHTPARLQKLTLDELQQGIFEGVQRVHEFQVLAQTARELDVEAVYLFGGAAAALAHYVQRDLVHQHMQNLAPMGVSHQASQEQSALAFDETEFDYELWSILFQNQDLDIVVDTHDPQKIQHLDAAIHQRLPTSNFHWDFWGLHTNYGNRPALLTSTDLAYQHTDSHSTVLIPVYLSPTPSLSGPASSHSIYDLRSDTPTFLTDVLEKKLSCYYSPKHRQTPRYQKGDNPEIFFAVRTLTKAFQYGLDISADCWDHLKNIFKNFDAKRDLTTGYSRYWIEKNAKKLYTSSIDLERSQHVLQQLGALQVLQNINGDKNELNSMAWWLNRQPLQSYPLNTSTTYYETAEQLGLHYVVHTTSSSEAYESIVNSHDKRPNAFISRAKKEGEFAAYGDGFYTSRVDDAHTCKNDYGPAGICFRVHPQAQLNTDFLMLNPNKNDDTDTIVVFKNKSALQIVNDAVSASTNDFKAWLTHGAHIDEKLQRLNKFKDVILFLLKRYPSQQEPFIHGLLDLSSTMRIKKYASFWNTYLPYIPEHYIALNYEQFLPPRAEKLIRNLLKKRINNPLNSIDDIAPLLAYLDNLKYSAYSEYTDFTRLHKLELLADELTRASLEASKSLHLQEYTLFWNDRLPLLSPYYVTDNYKQFIPAQFKRLVYNTSPLQVSKKARENFVYLIYHIDNIVSHTRMHGHDGQINAPWKWLLKTLLLKLKKLPLHTSSDVKIHPVFEALIARTLLEENNAYSTHSYPYNTATIWSAELVQLFESTVVHNIDYFIRHNNILILRVITQYILHNDANTWPPGTKLKILEKIIRYELSLQTSTLSPYYNIEVIHKKNILTYRGHALNNTKLISYISTPWCITDNTSPDSTTYSSDLIAQLQKLISDIWSPVPLTAEPLVRVFSNSSSDFLWALRVDTDDERKWSRLKRSKQLLKLIYDNTLPDEYVMVPTFMQRPWAQQDWSLDFLETIVNDALNGASIETDGKRLEYGASARISRQFIAELPNFLGTQDDRRKDTFSKAYLRISKILEKIIIFIDTLDKLDSPLEQALNDQPFIKQYYANKYFRGAQNFTMPQLRQRVQEYHQRSTCIQLLAQKVP